MLALALLVSVLAQGASRQVHLYDTFPTEIHAKQRYVIFLHERWVRQLLAAGVPASRITIVGFSRGSYITAYAADRLRDTGIHTALLGSCSNGDVTTNGAPLVLGGDLLNIYETTDSVRECGALAKRGHLTSFTEVAITTGKKHGAFGVPSVPTRRLCSRGVYATAVYSHYRFDGRGVWGRFDVTGAACADPAGTGSDAASSDAGHD